MPQLTAPSDFAEFRAAARSLLADAVPPADVAWTHAPTGELFAEPAYVPRRDAPAPRLARELVDLLDTAACHRRPTRWALLYRVLWRTLHGEPRLPADAADPDVAELRRLAIAVRHDVHRMHAFLRFREVAEPGGPRYVAWYEPDHLILERAAPFFVRRFANLRWTIATPDGALEWDGERLGRAPPPPPGTLPASDERESLWSTYYASIFNAARTNPRATVRHVPVRFWRNLPEGATLERLLGDGDVARARLLAAETAAADAGLRVDAGALAAARAAPRGALEACRNCALWQRATQPVGGEGPLEARIVLVGEAPGDEEDLAGRPFVGPAGRELDAALAQAGLDRARLYVTNAVKHFAWEPRGKRRLHRRPTPQEVDACSGWLREELVRGRPAVVVAAGATALRAVSDWRGTQRDARAAELRSREGLPVVATWHPAAILRAPADAAARMRAELVADLARAARLAEPTDAAAGGAGESPPRH